jgi:hypothetical protein
MSGEPGETKSKKLSADARAIKRAEREKRRAEALKAISDRNQEQRDEVEDLIDEMDINPLEVVIVATDGGVVACQKANVHEMARFNRAVTASVMPSRKRKGGDGQSLEEINEALVRGSRIYPEESKFEEILEKYPVVWSELAAGLVDLAGGSFSADVRKN